MDLGFGPGVGAGGLVVAGDEGIDVSPELGDAGEACAFLTGEDRESAFDLVEPGGMRRGEVEQTFDVSRTPRRTSLKSRPAAVSPNAIRISYSSSPVSSPSARSGASRHNTSSMFKSQPSESLTANAHSRRSPGTRSWNTGAEASA
jgi:hypothetical protein